MPLDREDTQRALLQPIKQLDKNWDIDIAAELEDYLHELTDATFTVNDQRHLNFAEAAMMIYSSSCSYSKKVDYLMKLTLAALESAKQQRQQQEAQGSNRRRRAQAEQADDTCRDVDDLIADIAAADPADAFMDVSSLSALDEPEPQPALLVEVLQSSTNPTVAHLVGPDRKDLPQQQLNSSKAAAMSPSDAPSFNMMRCHWHCSGTLLLLAADGLRYNYKLDTLDQPPTVLPGLSADMLIPGEADENAAPDPDAPDGFAPFGSPVVTAMRGSSRSGDHEPDALASAGNNGAGPPDAAEPPAGEPAWFGPEGDDDWAADGAGFEFDPPDMGAGAGDAGHDAAPVGGADADAAGPSRQSRRTQQPQPDPAEQPQPSLAALPTLDPNDTSRNKNKPFKMMVPKTPKFRTSVKQHHYQPFAMPDFIVDMQRRMEEIAALNPVLQAAQAQAGVHAAGQRKKRSRDRQSTARKSIINAGPLAQPGPAFDDADALQSPAAASDAAAAADAQPMDAAEGAADAQPPAAAPDGGGWLDMDFGPDDDADGGYGYDDAGPADPEPLPDFNFDGGDMPEFEGFGKGFGSQLEGSQLAGSSAYEELIAQYSQAVANAALSAMNQSTLARKVSSWREAISGIMVEQDRRPEFDVHSTGKRLLRQAAAAARSQPKAKLKFGQIVACEHKYQVARCFSAFLQQVNDGTVELLDAADGDQEAFLVRLVQAA